MADLQVLREEMGRAVAHARSIVTEYEGKALPPEKQSELERTMALAREKDGAIKAEQKMAEQVTALVAAERFLNEPVHKIPHGINGDDDDRKALVSAGYEIKGGLVFGPTSSGHPIALFPEEVLFGAIPENDAPTADYFRKTRAIFEPTYTTAYTKHFRAMARYHDPALAFNQLTPSEQKALSEGTDTAGGFLVPPDVQSELLARTAQMAIIRKYARVQPTSRDVVKWPRVQANSNSGSIYSSGFVGGWVGETPTASDTDPAFGTFDIQIKKLRVSTKLSNDFVADSTVNILAWLATNGAENMALVEDNGFITGDGGPLQPLGLNYSGATTVDVEGSTTDTISNTTSNAGTAPKLIDLVYTLPAQYTANARFLMRRAIEGKVRKLLDASGRFLWPAQTMSAFAAVQRELMGYPIDNSDFLDNDGTNANKVLWFGDFTNYIIAQRAQITSVVLRERYADNDQVGIILFERVGGGVFNTDAFRVGIV